MKKSSPAETAAKPAVISPAEHGFYKGGGHWNVDESIAYMLRKLTMSIRRHADAKMQERGLTNSQWKPLLLIAGGKGDTASALARELEVDNGAMTRMVDRLEAKGMLKRVWDDKDRRVARLELTKEGRHVTEMIPDAIAEVLNIHLRGFTRDEVTVLKTSLRRMLANGCEVLPCAGPDAVVESAVDAVAASE